MNIQQLAAEKAREKYPEDIGYTQTQRLLMNTQRLCYTDGFIDCLNHLAGSEGDVMNMVREKFEADEDWQLTLVGYPEWIKLIQEHTATHCAKVLSQQWVSVDESKPEIESNYFNSPISITVLGITRESRFVVCFYDYKKEKWYADGVEIYVTHWQPLPTPPINQ